MVLVKYEIAGVYNSIYDFITKEDREILRRKFGSGDVDELLDKYTDSELISAILEEYPKKYLLHFCEAEDVFYIFEILD